MNYFFLVLQGREILEDLILRGKYFTVLSLGTTFHNILPWANTGCSLSWEIHVSKSAIMKEINFTIPFLIMI